MNTDRLPNESLEQYLWRIGNNRSVLGLTWLDVTNLCNKYFQTEESALNESVYRKKYQAAKLFYDEVFSKDDSNTQDQLRELHRAKVMLRDERIAYNKQNREAARLDENLAYLGEQLKEVGRIQFPELTGVCKVDCVNDLILNISDVHCGLTFNNAFGQYDTDIMKLRLKEYLDKAIEIGHRHNAENCYLNFLGDLINGNIRLTVQLSNRENFIEQIKTVAEVLSSFIFEISKYFKNVFVTGVAGNHSRLVANKEDSVKGEKADDLVLWIVSKMLDHVDNIFVDTDVLDNTVTEIDVRGKTYVLTHGDMGTPSDASIGKLVTMLGHIPYCVLAGHMHSPFMREMNGVKFLQGGSLCGGGNDYTVQNRLSGVPSQLLLIANAQGIEAVYNVELH